MGMFSRRKEEGPRHSTTPTIAEPGHAASKPTPTEAPAGRATAKAARGAGSASSVLNCHLSFDGELRYQGTVTLDCEFKGKIATDDMLVIGPEAKVTAEVNAGVVEVSGKIHGNIHAKQSVKIYTGGEVYGNIESPTISMEEGVVFEGNCTRPPPRQAVPATARAAAQASRIPTTPQAAPPQSTHAPATAKPESVEKESASAVRHPELTT